MTTKVIRAAGMIDVQGGRRIADAQVVVKDKTIESVGNQDEPHSEPSDVIDLGELTLLPGMIDAHLHYFGVDSQQFDRYFLDSHVYQALRSVRDVSATLNAGFTSVRILGSFVDLVLARAINEGFITGPRIVGAGAFIHSRGGTWDFPEMPEALIEKLDMYADGEDEARRIVRRRIRAGAGVIKIGLSGGHFGDLDIVWGDDPFDQRLTYSQHEVEAMVEEAHASNVKVSAHAIGDAAVNLALDSGVDVIEHGHGVSDETRRRLRDCEVTVVSTLSMEHFRLKNGSDHGMSPELLQVARRHFDTQVASMQRSLELGVQYALGTDAIGQPVAPHGENATEYELAAQAVGLAPADVLRAGLGQGARVLGLESQIGSLETGKLADVIAVDGDPLQDISALKRVKFVMKDGEVVRHDAREGSRP